MIGILRHSNHGLGGLFALSMALVALASPSDAAERIALVIANGGYEGRTALPRAGDDAAVVADTLRGLDFDVESLRELDLAQMQARLNDFARRLDQADEDAVGLLFYAGRGFQLDGSNYLLPVDVALDEVENLENAAVNLDLALAEIAFAANEHKLVILDVPADGAVGERFGARPGLAAIDAPVGVLVAYGALPGVEDGRPPYEGLYPLALASVMAKPGLSVEEVFQEVRLNVVEATEGVQIPWESSSLVGPLYLAGPAERSEATSAPVEGDAGATFADVDPRAVDLARWTQIKDSADPSDFADYLEASPEGAFRRLAERRIADLKDDDGAPAARAAEDQVADYQARLIAQRRANVHATPDAGGVILATVAPHQRVEVTGKLADGEWLRVRFADAAAAFVWAPLLGSNPPSKDENGLAAILPPSKSALLGPWHGEYQCQWDTIGFTLDITDDEADRINAVFSFFPLPGSPTLPAGSFAMSGDYDPADGTIVLKSREWIEEPLGLKRHDLAGRAEIGGEAIAGRIETSGCSDFRLARGEGESQATVQSISAQ
jgi:hypothetical protein